MTRYVIVVLVIVGLGYWSYSWWQDHLESEQMQQTQDARRQVLKNSVAEMASKANAVTNWASNLADDKRTRMSPVLTAELQRLWVIDRPILFLGSIEDVAINHDGTYQVIVEHNWIGAQHMFLRNNIRVSLRCPEQVATPLIHAVKAERAPQLGADIAITGVIERIVTTSEKDLDGETIAVLTGIGKCISAIHLTEVAPFV